MILRTIREWEPIHYGNASNEISKRDADRIAAAASASTLAGQSGRGVLSREMHYLRAKGIVGLVAVPGCQLEILPKIDDSQNDSDKVSTPELRTHLVNMLSVVDDLKIDHGVVTKLSWQGETFLEILVHLFCEKVSHAVQKGLPHEYVSYEENLRVIRGRLDLVRQFSINSINPQRLACKFDELSYDTALSQLVKFAITRLMKLSNSDENQRKLRQIFSTYVEIKDVNYRLFDGSYISFDRSNQHWKSIVSFARLFLSDRYQDTRAGRDDGWSLLFDMSRLYEKYIVALAHRSFLGTDFDILGQGTDLYCLYKGDLGVRDVRPDIVVKRNEKTVLLIDTKWKVIQPHATGFIGNVPPHDIYQVMAYGQIYDCPEVVLLYPHHGLLQKDQIKEDYSIASIGSNRRLTIATFDITSKISDQVDSLRNLISS